MKQQLQNLSLTHSWELAAASCRCTLPSKVRVVLQWKRNCLRCHSGWFHLTEKAGDQWGTILHFGSAATVTGSCREDPPPFRAASTVGLCKGPSDKPRSTATSARCWMGLDCRHMATLYMGIWPRPISPSPRGGEITNGNYNGAGAGHGEYHAPRPAVVPAAVPMAPARSEGQTLRNDWNWSKSAGKAAPPARGGRILAQVRPQWQQCQSTIWAYRI